MNKSLISQCFSRAIPTYSREATVQKQIATKMTHLLKTHLTTPCHQVIEFGCGTGIYSRLLLQALRPHRLMLNDLCPQMKTCFEELLGNGVTFVPGDAEHLPFPVGTELTPRAPPFNGLNRPKISSSNAKTSSPDKAI